MEVLRQRLQDSPAEGAASPEWDLCFQSRSGPPQVPWLEPDVSDRLRAAAASGIRRVVLVPLGFLSDHIEVLWDLDTVAAADAAEVGLDLVRARTPGHLDGFAEMLVDVLSEYLDQTAPAGTSSVGPTPAVCAADCCLPVARRGRPASQD